MENVTPYLIGFDWQVNWENFESIGLWLILRVQQWTIKWLVLVIWGNDQPDFYWTVKIIVKYTFERMMNETIMLCVYLRYRSTTAYIQ